MRPGVIAALLVIANYSPVHADPVQLEASGFVGVAYFPEASQLGDSWAPDQRPGTAPVAGARLSVIDPELFVQNGLALQGGIETEISAAAAYTGGTAVGDGGRQVYFAPVFGWRAHAIMRVASDMVALHLVAGVGGETVASSSPYMRKETDPQFYWGPGVGIPVGDGDWSIRFDVRHGLMAARDGGLTSTIELQIGVGATFGLPLKKHVTPPRKDLPPPQPIVDEHDTDGDGIPDRLDKCPTEKETPNGIADDDGCPEPDTDGDNILNDADKCPDQAEDFDGFEDTDGCPEPDNDGDGVEDARDKCPLQPETRNGYDDDDGCPDAVPPEVGKLLAPVAKLAFEPNRARVTDKAKQLLAPVIALLGAYSSIKIVVIGHPPNAGADDLAKRRADAVKWHLIDEGMIAEDRVETRVGEVKKTGSIEIQLIVR